MGVMSTASAALTSTIFGNQTPCNRRWMEISHQPPSNAGMRSFTTRAAAGERRDEKKQGRKSKRKQVQEEEKSPPQDVETPPASTASTTATATETASSVSAIKSRLDEMNPVGLGQISRTTRNDDDEAALLIREVGGELYLWIPHRIQRSREASGRWPLLSGRLMATIAGILEFKYAELLQTLCGNSLKLPSTPHQTPLNSIDFNSMELNSMELNSLKIHDSFNPIHPPKFCLMSKYMQN